MEVLINELSLDGQFIDEDDFFNNLTEVLYLIKIFDELDIDLLKEYCFFNSQITSSLTLLELLKSKRNEIRRLKSLLAKLVNNPPFWNATQKHLSTDRYEYNSINILNSSVAESCERDKVILSFKHDSYLDNTLNIYKNKNLIKIFNIINHIEFFDFLYSKSLIMIKEYCLVRFKNTNLNFELLDDKNSFNILNDEQSSIFLDTFIFFSEMNWENISKSDSLRYKEYNGDWFKNTKYSNQRIDKFRISAKYRCFGFKKDNIFNVLRFEVNHKKSDNG